MTVNLDRVLALAQERGLERAGRELTPVQAVAEALGLADSKVLREVLAKESTRAATMAQAYVEQLDEADDDTRQFLFAWSGMVVGIELLDALEYVRREQKPPV